MADFARRFAIAGLGVVAGRFPDRSARTLQVEAARRAIDDAGLQRQDIDGAINAAHEIAPPWSDAFPRILGLPSIFYITMGRGGALVPQALLAATQALHLGLARHVVVAYGASDWSRSRDRQRRGHRIEKTGTWGRPYGDLSAASHHSFFMSRHMHEFGTTHAQLGAVAVAARQWARHNPDAYFRDRPLSLDEYLAAPFLVEPYRAADMCQISDVGVAFVLTTAERARDLPKPPVYLLGLGFGEAIEDLWWEKRNYTRLAVEGAKRAAFAQAEVALKEVDVAQLYDCFTGEVILQLEDYGWCAKGEGGVFAASGAIAPGGGTPINTGGGLLASYHAADFTLLVETVQQLRGEAGARQVPNAGIGLMSGHGGEMLGPGMCSLHATTLWSNA
jgi:acetyl-CoA acetyltransferase